MKKSEFFIPTNTSRVFPFFLFLLCCAGQLSAATWYVKTTGSDAASGNSWANAYQTLTKALQSAASGDQIWVASGTYKPTTGTDRTISFNMKTGVTILGGFPATGNPVLADRDWETHVTTLSGDIGTAGDNSDNSYHVVSNFNVGISAVLDGFTLTAGSSSSDGGGMYCISSSPRIENCRFVSNGAVRFGAGLFCGQNSNAVLNNCFFYSNYAGSIGGGISSQESNLTISNTVFSGNSGTSGAGLCIQDAPANVTNCVFSGNLAGNLGGGMLTWNAASSVTNCSFSGNLSSSNTGGLVNYGTTSAILRNCIFWGNKGSGVTNVGGGTALVTYSIVQGGYAGAGNLNVDPMFVEQPPIAHGLSGDLRLQACSPAINKGSDAAVPAGVTTDLDGNNRFYGTVDMGAYEYQSNAPPPVAACKNITVQLDATGNVSVPASAADNGSTGCGSLTFYLSQTNFNCSKVGVNNLLFVVSDNNFHSASCAVIVTVQDNTVPTAACKNASLQLDASGNASLAASAINNGSADACGIASLALNQPTFNCSNVGANTVTLTATDNNGKTATCSATVTVQDNILPTAACKNATVQLDATGNVTVPASAVNNGSADACGIAALVLNQATFNCSNVGANTVTLTVTDNHGKTATCTSTVTVQDNTLPTAICKNATVQLDATGNVTVPASAVDNGSADACGIAALTLSKSNFNCSNAGNLLVSLEVRDNNGNNAYCSTTITVQDNVAPTALCKNATVQLDASGNATLTTAAINNGSADACGIASLALSKTTFDCTNIGPNTVTLTATDNNGKTATCSATVTVQDNVAPTAVCQNATVQLDAAGNATLAVAAVNNGSADACGIASLSLSKTAFDCSNTGANTVTLTATDNNGKTATCSATVTVQDNVAPTAVCQNVTVQLDAAGNTTLAVAAVNNGSADACGIASLSLSKTAFDCSNTGANTVTLTVTDNNGKTATCSATVTVQDNIAPTVTCPGNLVVAPNQNNPCSALVDAGLNVTVNDNCEYSLIYQFFGALTGGGVSQVPATTFPAGVTTIMYTATDGGQNAGQCTFQVTVGSCSITVSGKLIWEHDDTSGVGNAVVSLEGDENESITTTADGLFSFSVTPGSELTLKPTKTINKLNGVSAADAARIQQHVANVNLITDPYKLVAADVNKSNSITTQDASTITQALLGNPAAMAQFKTSWRFVPASHNLSNPPWGFPENLMLTNVNSSLENQNFIGIKTGDVITPYTNPANFNGSSTSEFVLNATEQSLQFGEQVSVVFSADQFSDLAALQFALKFDVEKLAFVGIEPLGSLPISAENFGTYNISEGAINVAWSQAEGVFVDEAAPVFQLTFNVLETGGKLSEAIQLAEDVLEGHAYTSTLTDNVVQLNFFGTTSSDAPIAQPQIELLQNRPNPFVGRTTIGFVLPESCEAQLRVVDASGRVLFSQKKNYAAGRHEETLELGGASGVLWYELVTPFGVLAKKMVVGDK